MDFVVMQDYRAFYGEEVVNLKKGNVVALDEGKACWIERDSPGTLEVAIPELGEVVQEEAAERELRPVQDRMMKGGKTRGEQD